MGFNVPHLPATLVLVPKPHVAAVRGCLQVVTIPKGRNDVLAIEPSLDRDVLVRTPVRVDASDFTFHRLALHGFANV